MPLGVLTVGSLTLNENYTIQDATNASSGKRTVTLGGIETFPGRSLAQLRALGEDIMSMFGRTVPVVFQHKTDRSGYYTVDDANVSEVHWDGEASSITWSLSLTREGPDNAVDIESRLLTVNRTKVYAGTPEPWHAPPIGHHTYYVGANTPPTVVRNGADGPITVYRNIPAGVNPRYGLPVGSWGAGRVKFADVNGIVRTGSGIKLGGTDFWELNNGLVRVRPNLDSTFTALLVAFWDGSAWQEKAWDVRIAGDSLRPTSHFQAVTVLRNGPEMVTLRILAAQPSNGQRVLLDLVLRRGSRILEGYVQRTVSGTISVQLDVAENFNAPSGGYTIAAGPDSGSGLRSVAGSAGGFAAATNGGVSNSSAAVLDFWIGAEVPGAVVGTTTNGGFELGDTSGWTPTAGTLTVVNSAPTPIRGAWAGKLVADGTGAARADYYGNAPVTAGKSYTLTGWLRSDVDLSSVQIGILWTNSGAYLSGSTASAPLTAGSWTPFTVTGVAPTNANQAGRQFALNSPTTAGLVLYADDLVLREATDSGDTADTLALQYAASTRETMVVVPR